MLTGVIPNIIYKIIETRKPKEDLSKTTIEAADTSLEMMTEVNKQLRDHNLDITSKLAGANAKILVLTNILLNICSLEIVPNDIREDIRKSLGV
jgi:hypothetical protein